MNPSLDSARPVIPQLSLQNFAGSREYMERARTLIPLGVTSSRRAEQRPVPIVIARAQGSRVYDIDGNEYIDYLAGWGPMLLGHQAKPVVDAVCAQLTRGGEIYGASHEGELELAERLVRLVPSAEMTTFLSSGSEAVHLALAIARGATGRRRVLKFDGTFHGWISPMQTNMAGMEPVGPQPPYPARPQAGWPASDDIVICPWNDIAAFEAMMAEVGDSLAAVILEPVAVNMGCIFPVPGFLERARELCDAHGTVLIFDEVITGFRLALGSAQQLFGVTPDLTTFAKALGNGFPISAIAGRRDVMSAASEGPIRTLGTYNGNPLAVAAANGTLAELEHRGDAMYESLERRSTALADGILASAQKYGVPLRVNRAGSILSLAWGLDREPVTYRDVVASDHVALGLLEEQLIHRGVYTAEGRKWFVSAAHSDEDIAKTLELFDDALRETVS